MNLQNMTCITLTSNSYLDYTLNMLHSLKNLGLDNLFTTYCLDESSFYKLGNLGFNVISYSNKLLDNKELEDEFKYYGTTDFNKFMYAKMDTIRKELKKYPYVIYSDSDVVFKKDFLKSENLFKNLDFLAMKDFSADSPQKTSICAGFMIIKSNIKTKYLFNPKDIQKKNFSVHDQEVINSKKHRFNYDYLDENKFSNGSYFCKYYSELDPSVVHFNYIVGNKKKDVMKELNCWYI